MAAHRLLLLLRPSTSATVRCIRPTSSRGVHLRRASSTSGERKSHTSPERLKRRTRSGAAFDADVYLRYAGAGGHHVPVLLCEVLRSFRRPVPSFVDCTLGSAAHAAAIIAEHPEMEIFIGMDVDPVAHDIARARLEALLDGGDSYGNPSLKLYTHVGNFKHIARVLGTVDESLPLSGVHGILMDLGMSSMQVDCADRGFGVLQDGPLDMRMDPQVALRAEDILNMWPEAELGHILREYGEESDWRSLQKQIVQARSRGGLHSTGELVQLIQRTSRVSGGRHGWIKTATRVFQALRIAVNNELQTLEDALCSCFRCLASGGRLAVISFHSLEDRIVKKTFLDLINSEDGDPEDTAGAGSNYEEEAWCSHPVRGRKGMVLMKRPITPSEEEEALNPRCRSAKLRIVQKF